MPDGMSDWLRERPLPARVGIYAATAMVAFLLSTGVGALAALIMGADLALPGEQELRSFGGGEGGSGPLAGDADTSEQEKVAREGTGQGENGAASTRPPPWEALRGCERSQEDCARDFVAGVAPKAEYAGGRIDTGTSGQTRTVLYFVDARKAPCEYKRFESAAGGDGGSHYVVLIAGEGSFGQQPDGDGEANCLPEL